MVYLGAGPGLAFWSSGLHEDWYYRHQRRNSSADRAHVFCLQTKHRGPVTRELRERRRRVLRAHPAEPSASRETSASRQQQYSFSSPWFYPSTKHFTDSVLRRSLQRD